MAQTRAQKDLQDAVAEVGKFLDDYAKETSKISEILKKEDLEKMKKDDLVNLVLKSQEKKSACLNVRKVRGLIETIKGLAGVSGPTKIPGM